MLSQATKYYLESLVEHKCHLRESFTSLDIANDAKSRGHHAKNRDVSQWMRSNVISITHRNGGMYNQTLINVDSKRDGFTKAYLYHDHEKPADDYLDRDQNPQPLVVAKQTNPYNGALRKGLMQRDTTQAPLVTSTQLPPSSLPTATQVTTGHSGWKKQRRDANGRWI